MSKKEEEKREYKAIYRHAPISAQKARMFADLIRGLNADDALDLLEFYPNRGAHMLYMTLKSAIGNANDRRDPNPQELIVMEVRIDEGTMMKRWRPKSRGMSTIVKKRSSHITVVLG